MADIIPPGYAEISIPHKHVSLNRTAYVTFGISVLDVLTVADVDGILASYDTQLGARIDNEVTLGPAEARIGQDGGEALVVVGATTQQGAANIDSIAANNAVLIHKRTTRGGRRGRGRMYVPWACPDSSLDQAGRIITAEVTALQLAATSFLTDLNADTNVGDMVVLHSESRPGTSNPTTPGNPNVVTSLQVDNIIGTQRRRLGR